MKINFFLIVILFSAEHASSQFRMLYQEPKVYKQNSVRCRIKLFKGERINSVLQVDFFDHDGLLTESSLYDSLAKSYIRKSIFMYDESHKLVAQTNYFYQFMDTITKQVGIKAIPDSEVIKFEFDSIGRKIKSSYYSYKILHQLEISYDALVETNTLLYPDSSRQVSSWYFDDRGMENGISSSRFARDGEVLDLSVYRFKNKYDKDGKLTGRKIKMVSDPAVSTELYLKNEEYRYLESGLLASSSSYNKSAGKRHGTTWLYDYKFW
ncbi:MAG: hypothetical protein ABIT58_05095 [Ferruginibacter sp.]